MKRRLILGIDVGADPRVGSHDLRLNKLLEEPSHRRVDIVDAGRQELGTHERVKHLSRLLLYKVRSLRDGRHPHQDRIHAGCETLTDTDDRIEILEYRDTGHCRLIGLDGVHAARVGLEAGGRSCGVATSTLGETTAPATAAAKKVPSTSDSKLRPSWSVSVITAESG